MSNDRRRNQRKINPKKIILISYEGDNKTEKYYFENFNGREKSYVIKSVHGNEADPVNLVKNTIKEVETMNLKLKEGDRAFCVFDTDTNIAVENARKLEKFQIENGKIIGSVEANPHTKLYEIIMELEKDNDW